MPINASMARCVTSMPRGSRLLVVGDRFKRLAADAPIDPAPDEQPEQPDEQCDPVEVNFVGNDCIILKPNVLKTKLPGLERYCDLRVFVPMSSDRIIVDAIKVAERMPRLFCVSANPSVRRRYDRSWSAAATHSPRLHCEQSSG